MERYAVENGIYISNAWNKLLIKIVNNNDDPKFIIYFLNAVINPII